MKQYDNIIPLSQEQIDKIKEEVRDETAFKIKTTYSLQCLTDEVEKIGNKLEGLECNGRLVSCTKKFENIVTDLKISHRLLFFIILSIMGIAFSIINSAF